MTHPKDVREQIAKIMTDYGVDFYEGNLMHRTEQRLALVEDFQSAIESLFVKTELNTLARASKIIKEEILGCDGYEKESDSIRCQWCGETEFSSNHAKARVLAQLTKNGEK